MSIAYPLVRSMPVVFVAIVGPAVSMFTGRCRDISLQGLCGMALIVVGAILLPMATFRDFRLKNYLTPMCLLACVAALGTTGYMIVDDHALYVLRTVRHADSTSLLSVKLTLLFAFFEGISASAWLAAYIGCRPGRLRSLRGTVAGKIKPAIATGVGICVSYTMVLIAMGLVKNVSYVVAFRQTSILVGGLFGIMILKEPRCAPKLAGLGCALAGLVLVATG